jgi:hypothetical protein
LLAHAHINAVCGDSDPQPRLFAWLQRYRGYHRVPADAWAQFDLDIADWQARRIRRLKWA